jgi:hypothetical protein
MRFDWKAMAADRHFKPVTRPPDAPISAMCFNSAMGGSVRYVLRRHLFLLIGLLTLGIFFLVAGLDRTGKSETAAALAGPMRLLIVPMYLVWMVFTMALVALFGPRGIPGPLGVAVSFIGFAAGLAPYVLVDYLLQRRRRSAARKSG